MATLQLNSHQVDILFNSEPNPICAGTLISSYLVLTVFSCLVGKNETQLKVRAPSGDASFSQQIRNVDIIYSYPALRSNYSEKDIAVLLLDSDFNLGTQLRSINIIDYNSNATKELFGASPSSSPSCANIPVEKTEQSECRTANLNLVCLKVAQKNSCPLPAIGSGLICQVHGLNFLCGALVRNRTSFRVYADISKYLHWIRLTFKTRSGGYGNHHHVNGLGPTIFMGREVSASGVSTSIPYQLSLQEQSGGVWAHICGAIIIDNKTALTAAHCFDNNYGLSAYRVVAGVTKLDSNSTTKQILALQRIRRHSGYQPTKWFLGNDIAILHVRGSFVYNENVQNIWISPPQEINPTDFTGRISGWGKTSRTGGTSNSLQEVDMRILPDSECKQTWSFLKPSMICIYDYVSNGCKGDSGGPLVVKNYQFNQQTTRDLLVGVASFSPEDCEKRDMPNGLTEIGPFFDWIQKNRGLKCGATEFQCLNGHCIDECSLCNGFDDCGDGSDEEEKQCPVEILADFEKKASCLQKKQQIYEKREEELKTVIDEKNQKIQELEELVKTLKKTIVKISEKIDEKVCLDGVDSSEVTFYEDKDFAGSEMKMKVGCSCQEIPEEWKNRVSSLKSSSCVTFFRGNSKCLGWRQQLIGNQADLTSYNSDNQVSSFELCEATAERRRQEEQTPPRVSSSQRTEMRFPYLLSVQEFRFGTWEHAGGGVLLDERTALTSATSFYSGKPAANYRLVAGMRQLNGNETTRQILRLKSFTRHDKWNGNFMNGNDIALLTVDGSFVLNEIVRPVWISSPDDPILSDFNGTATGWGKTSDSSGPSNDLKIMNMPLLPFERCKEMLSAFKDNMICSHGGKSNICGLDNGDPLVLENYVFPDGSKRDLLVGIGSFGARRCEDLRQPSVFTKVSSHYDWIVKRWKRNTTAPNKFKCFNGQEIDGDFRFDEEFDCADGSDEKGCPKIKDEDRPKTRGCGGEIQLVEEHDIIYRAENLEPGKMSQCVWTIFNQKNNHIELTLLNNNIDANFDPAQNQFIALHNFTLQNFDYKFITRIGQKRTIADSFTTLIFRRPAAIQNPGSGFHLRVKSVGLNTEKNPLKFKREELTPNLQPQNYSYPSSEFYGVNERIFTILPPSQKGNKIRLNVNFGELEGNRDWVDIISIAQQPKSLFRFSGARSWTNNTNANTFEGAPDESLLVFMSTGGSAVKRKGIRFTYSQF